MEIAANNLLAQQNATKSLRYGDGLRTYKTARDAAMGSLAFHFLSDRFSPRIGFNLRSKFIYMENHINL